MPPQPPGPSGRMLRPWGPVLGALALLAVLVAPSEAAAGSSAGALAEGGGASSEPGGRLLHTLLADPTTQQQRREAGTAELLRLARQRPKDAVAAAAGSGSQPTAAVQPSAAPQPSREPQQRKLPQLAHGERRLFTNETAPAILKRIANRRRQVGAGQRLVGGGSTATAASLSCGRVAGPRQPCFTAPCGQKARLLCRPAPGPPAGHPTGVHD